VQFKKWVYNWVWFDKKNYKTMIFDPLTPECWVSKWVSYPILMGVGYGFRVSNPYLPDTRHLNFFGSQCMLQILIKYSSLFFNKTHLFKIFSILIISNSFLNEHIAKKSSIFDSKFSSFDILLSLHNFWTMQKILSLILKYVLIKPKKMLVELLVL
jgi:hypothetical protein